MSAAPMRIVVLGLSLSSAWGNGHATTYRALLRAFAARGHEVVFLEREVPWYAGHRDLAAPDYCALEFYRGMDDLLRWRGEIALADAVVVGSFVPEGVAVGDMVQCMARGVTAFYDIDTPVTLAKLARGEEEYLAGRQIRGYDLYLSFTGGPTLALLEARYGSPAARVLHCSVDPEAYPVLDAPRRWDLSYLGTYSDDRQPVLEALLLEPARQAPQLRFVVAGAQYPDDIAWPPNVERLEHVPPADHPAFYAASRFTLNVTRQDMVRAGHSPSVRLFEAGACGTPVISDAWDGIEALFRPGEEILLADRPGQVRDILLGWPDASRDAVARAFRARVLADHTAAHRAAELEAYLLAARRRVRQPARVRAAT
ncbi:glycosyltransferase [Dankookia rubra]|uniref:Glycosyltransferase n=1 Tax=Dankookia rubra TaxID=1442381 RepID=A0A4R5QP48_9PROT|nr:glycosyltransferase [Dankookia rubra]TDH64578.1 glycosyltransferase [Dankookia rubra]